MIDKSQFQQYFTMMAERFNKLFSKPTVSFYYESLSAVLTSESFVAAARKILAERVERDGFPSPKEIIETAKSIAPTTTYELPPGTPPAWEEATPEERQFRREQFAQLRQSLQSLASSKSFSPLGETTASPIDSRYLQDLARFDTYRRTYEAYCDSVSHSHLADRAVAQIRLLETEPDVDSSVVSAIGAFLAEIGASAITDDIAASIADQMRQLEEIEF